MSAAGSQSNEKLPDEVPDLVAIMQELSLLKERVAFLEQSAPPTPDNVKTSIKRFCKNIAQLGKEAHSFQKETFNRMLQHCDKYPENKDIFIEAYEALHVDVMGEPVKDASYDVIITKMSQLVLLPKGDAERLAKLREIMSV